MSLEPTFEPFSVRSPWQWETLAMTSTGPRRRYDPSRGRGVLIFRGADDRRRDQAVLPRPKPRRTSRPAGPDPRRRTRARRPGDAAGAARPRRDRRTARGRREDVVEALQARRAERSDPHARPHTSRASGLAAALRARPHPAEDRRSLGISQMRVWHILDRRFNGSATTLTSGATSCPALRSKRSPTPTGTTRLSHESVELPGTPRALDRAWRSERPREPGPAGGSPCRR